MNRRLSSAIACCIGLLIALMLLTTSVPWMQAATRETTNQPVLFPQRAPVPSVQKRRSVTLPILDRTTLTSTHKRLAKNVLTTLPSSCRTHLENFYVLYDGARQRGLGGKTTIILDGTLPNEEFLALLVHECGHVTHGNLTGTRSTGESAFTDGNDRFYQDSVASAFFAISWETEHVLHENTTADAFVSGYAKTNAFEDFAETFAAYVLHRSLLQKRAQTNVAIAAKLAWMETHLPLPENSLAVSTYVSSKTIPWDITKLPITL